MFSNGFECVQRDEIKKDFQVFYLNSEVKNIVFFIDLGNIIDERRIIKRYIWVCYL